MHSTTTLGAQELGAYLKRSVGYSEARSESSFIRKQSVNQKDEKGIVQTKRSRLNNLKLRLSTPKLAYLAESESRCNCDLALRDHFHSPLKLVVSNACRVYYIASFAIMRV